MALSLYMLVLCFTSVLCDECVRYTFENDYESKFSNQVGICTDIDMNFWNHSNYTAVSIEGPRGKVGSFISPLNTWSCVSSFTFSMRVGGTVEVNIYMEAASQTDQITLLAKQKVDDGYDTTIGMASATPLDGSFVSGWQTLKVNVVGVSDQPYNGYITLLGIASPNSLVLVDSFRYLPPSITDESMCDLYEEYSVTASAPEPTTRVPEATTIGRCPSSRFQARKPAK